MKRILCPTDFSETAHNAIAFAGRFAQVTDAELVLLYVQSAFELTPAEFIRGKSEKVELAKLQLDAQCREITKAFKIPCYNEVQVSGAQLSGIIGDNAKPFDLIIMGTNGPNDMYQYFSGSNTYHVIRQAAVPVLMVPSDCTYQDIHRMVYAYDYLKEGKLPMEQLFPWLEKITSEVVVLEVLEPSRSVKVDREMKSLQAMFRRMIPGDVNLTFDSIHSSSVIDDINQYVLEHNGDMLILCTVEHSWIGMLFHTSVIKALAVMARYPVLVIHH